MNSIQRSDMAVIGTWRDNMRTDEALARKWFAKHGMNELVNDVITRCPTKTIMLKEIKDVDTGDRISSVKVSDTHALEIDNSNCVRCMHCINVMTGALAHGTDTGATILIGGKRTLKIGDLMGTVVVPFMPLKTDEDYEALVDLGQKVIDFFAENALEHERTGEMIERIGLVNFLEGIGVEIDANMVSTPRTNPYVNTDGWDEEVAKHQRQEGRGLNQGRQDHGHAHPDRERRPRQQAVPAPDAAEELRQLEVPRPAAARRAAPRVAQRRRGLDACAPARSARWTSTRSASCATSPTPMPKGMCGSRSAATSSSWCPTRTRSHR